MTISKKSKDSRIRNFLIYRLRGYISLMEELTETFNKDPIADTAAICAKRTATIISMIKERSSL